LGTLFGALVASVVFAPAAWLAAALQSASGERLLLADARGSVWRGSAVLVLTGGPGSRDASALPGRLHWTLGVAPGAAGLELRARQACCLNGQALLRLQPGWGRLRVHVLSGEAGAGASVAGPAAPALIGQWPAAWLVGLGTPWNTLQPSGQLRLRSPGLGFELVQGSLRISGRAELDLDDIASRISTLEVLGSYRLNLQGDRLPANEANEANEAAEASDAAEAVAQAVDTPGATLSLSTRSGALQLSGNGRWAAGRLRFRGEARAAPGAEAVLSNLLNIIGRRQGAAAVISIG
jgi:general secretion pathway protein N